jgi:polyketide cyclase/dehydrase/lipid transport protein
MAERRLARWVGGWCRWFGVLLPVVVFLLPASCLGHEDLWSQVRIAGEWIFADVSFSVPATRAQVWEVLTDFEHMAGFISNLATSTVIAREGQALQVYQKGVARRGLLVFPFESVREVRLTPMSHIESHLLRGSMARQDGSTDLSGEGAETRVVFHGESVPGVWIPPLVGKGFIEQELREQFLELRAEILRRHGPPPATPAGHGAGAE